MAELNLAKMARYLGCALEDNRSLFSFDDYNYLTFNDEQLSIHISELPEEVWLWLVNDQPKVAADAIDKLISFWSRTELRKLFVAWYEEEHQDA